MEEKTIKMTPDTKDSEVKKSVKEPSYDKIKEDFNKMYQENQYLRMEINKAYKIIEQIQVDNGFKRLDCLFKSLEYAHYFDNEFIDDIVNEIKGMIIIKEDVDGSEDVREEEPTDETANE